MCKAGQIQEAYNIAVEDLENEPQNVGSHREVGWALYYMIKGDADAGNYDELVEHFNKLKSLELLTIEQDNLIFDNALFDADIHAQVTD